MHTIDRIVNETPLPIDAPIDLPIGGAAALPPPAPPDRKSWGWIVMGVLVALMLASLALAWSARERVRQVEKVLAGRQQDSSNLASEARMLARQAQDTATSSAAKVALLEARLAEVALQRTQLEDLIQSLSRSRDENLVVDIEAGLRVAQQQSAITGSAEPLMAALKQSDERLQRYSQPRLDGVRRALARDIDRVKAVGVADIASLSIKLDEAVRLVDELPLLSQAISRKDNGRVAAAAAVPVATSTSGPSAWWDSVSSGWNEAVDATWTELRSLVRVTQIDHPDAALMAPEQAFFVRENLKLRLLNARLALLSRQFDTTQTDLQAAQTMLERYFDRGSRRTTVAADLVRQVMGSARNVALPRPDESLAALSAAAAGR
jgi:uroporphyrin-3 C-methyltransferase